MYLVDMDKINVFCNDKDVIIWKDFCASDGFGICVGIVCDCDFGDFGFNVCQIFMEWICDQDGGSCIYKGDLIIEGIVCDDGDVSIGGDKCDVIGICVGIFCTCTNFGLCYEVIGFICIGDGICVYVNWFVGISCDDSNECME